jgi:hypothetical protein
LQGLYYFRAPQLKGLPATPLPDPDENPEWYGEIWLQLPSSPGSRISTNHGHVFKAIVRLRQIANDIASIVFQEGKVTRSLTFTEIVAFRRRLDEWYAELPEPIMPRHMVFPSHLKVQ